MVAAGHPAGGVNLTVVSGDISFVVTIALCGWFGSLKRKSLSDRLRCLDLACATNPKRLHEYSEAGLL
jgi:hypothetical protein